MLVVVLIATFFSITKGWTNNPPHVVVKSIQSNTLYRRKSAILQQSTIENNENTEIPSSCPFSMRFPRYRIDLSGSSSISRKNEKKKVSDYTPGLFSTFKMTIDKLALQQKYDKKGYTIQYKDNLFSKLQNNNKKNDEQIKKGEMGIHISAAFWRELADCSSNSSFNYDDKLVLAFPEASHLTLKRLVDVANWLETYISKNENIFKKMKAFIHAEIDETMEIPTVILTKLYNEKYEHPSEQTNNIMFENFETIINQRTKAWVKRVLVNYGICPFTKSTTRSGQGLGDLGVPVGKIAYHASDAAEENILELMAGTHICFIFIV